MRRGACLVVALAALGVGSALAAHGLIVVTPSSPVIGMPAKIELRTSANLKPPVYVTGRYYQTSVRARLRRIAPKRWRGTLTFPKPGSWKLSAAGATSWVLVKPPPASTFTPLGGPGCNPPSPANATTDEALGSNGLWAWLQGGRLADPHAAVLDGVVGKPTKIVWRMVGTGDIAFVAIGPGGTRVEPTGVVLHGSTWQRPGDEWGSSFVFTAPGCRQIHAERANASGDLWLVARS